MLSFFIDVGDLQNFVSVALSTAAGGEGDLANDQLSKLRTVGSGFGSLIYNLRPDTGFLVFKERCKSLWDSLRHTPLLPTLLVSKICHSSIVRYELCISYFESSCSLSVTNSLDGINL